MSTIVASNTSLVVDFNTGLTLTSDSTIATAGTLLGGGTVSGAFALVDDGNIVSNSAAGSLSIDTASFTNAGTVTASYNNSITSNNIVTIIPVTFSPFIVQQGVSVTNLVNGTLSGGVWNSGSDLEILAGAITDDNASIVLDNPFFPLRPVTFEGFDAANGTAQPIQNSLSIIDPAGSLQVGDNFGDANEQTWNVPLTVNGGLAVLLGATLTAAAGFTLGAAGTISGSNGGGGGTIIGNMVLDGSVNSATGLTLMGDISGTGTLQNNLWAGTVAGHGALSLGSGTITAALANNAPLQIINNGSGGTTTIDGSLSGSGAFDIYGGTSADTGTALVLPAGAAPSVDFTSGVGTLVLNEAFYPSADFGIQFGTAVSGFNDNDMLVINGVSGATASLSFTANPVGQSGTLTVRNQANAIVAEIPIVADVGTAEPSPHDFVIYNIQNYGAADFTATYNAVAGNTTITATGITTNNAPCFRSGTRIAVPGGETVVEQLRIGDLVQTRRGQARPIVWIGHWTVDRETHPDPRAVDPVRIAQDAFGYRRPSRPLYLSLGHAVWIDNALIPVRFLINDLTIVQVPVETVDYWHVELDEHDIVLAEGLAVESFLDVGGDARPMSYELAERRHAVSGPHAWELTACAPLVMTGPALERARAALLERAIMPHAREAWLPGLSVGTAAGPRLAS